MRVNANPNQTSSYKKNLVITEDLKFCKQKKSADFAQADSLRNRLPILTEHRVHFFSKQIRVF